MSTLSIIVLAVISISMIVLGLSLSYAMVSNFNQGKVIREELLKRINKLRYGRALKYFGINKKEFIHKVPLVEIENGLRSCSGCEHTKQCDKTLQKLEECKDEGFDFCPNSKSLKNHKSN